MPAVGIGAENLSNLPESRQNPGVLIVSLIMLSSSSVSGAPMTTSSVARRHAMIALSRTINTNLIEVSLDQIARTIEILCSAQSTTRAVLTKEMNSAPIARSHTTRVAGIQDNFDAMIV